MTNAGPPYATYADVPYYRKQGFFWLLYFLLAPFALAILISGDVYYQKKGEVKAFGLANRIVAGLIGIFWAVALVQALTGH